MNCRHCGSLLQHTFLDLGFAPPSNAYLSAADLTQPEKYFPLKIMVCDRCWLVQTEDYASAGELFGADYAYFSSTSASWLTHAARYAEQAIQQFQLGRDSMVIEVASNDGYLLKNFVAAGIPCLGIEPTASTAAAAEHLGIAVIQKFFGERLGKQLAANGKQADLIVGNNVYAHVPDIDDFTRGLKSALKPEGAVTLEFPHLLRLIDDVQFDTVYHEHFSYLSLYIVGHVFERAGLRVWDVETLPTHGGSLRVYGCHAEHPREYGRAERPTHFGAGPLREHERDDAEDEGERGHQDRPEPEAAGFQCRFSSGGSRILGLLGELDNQDRVLARQTDEHHEANLREEAHVHPAEVHPDQ